ENIQYIEYLTAEQLRGLRNRCLLADPGRQDLLYCLYENSQAKIGPNALRIICVVQDVTEPCTSKQSMNW
ncbi:hypothetical protein BD560DRAFT_336668, partial [Blakeslea trispora]